MESTEQRAAHTPGPWMNHGRFSQPGLPHSVVVAKTLIARVYSEAYGDSENEAANAYMIAAAPDLFKACQTFCEWLRREEEGFKGDRGTPEGEAAWREWYDGNLALCALAQELARAAVAKATGEQQ